MSDWIHISLTQASTDDLYLTASLSDRAVETSAPYPRGIKELVAQIKDGEGTRGAQRALGAMLGDVLFAGPMLAVLRELMGARGAEAQDGLSLVLFLELEEELASLPWELTADPETGELLVAHDRELVRVGGEPVTSAELQNMGVVVSSPSEAYRLSALKAAATQLRRRFHTKVESIQSEEELSAFKGAQRALFCHIYAADRFGHLTLNAELKHLSESSIAQRAHLLNITPCLSAEHAFKARCSGASLVLNRQVDLSVKASAESDRALYHSFGSGRSAVEALWEARRALRKASSGYDWASLTLTAPPPEVSGDWERSLVFAPFPPPMLTERLAETSQPVGASREVPAGEELQVSAPPAPLAPITKAIAGATFVEQTVRLVQDTQRGGLEEDRVDLALRTNVMKQLSAIAKRRGRPVEQAQGLTRSELLTQQLISAARFEDQALRSSPQWYGYAESLARDLGLRVEGVAQAVRALLVSKSVWLYGVDPSARRRLARGICDVIYQSYPFEVNGAQAIAPLELTDRADGGRNGALWESAHLAWAADVSQPLNAGRRRPKDRARVAAYHAEANAWRLYERLWLIVDQAELTEPDERYRVSQALNEGALRGVTTSGEAACCYLPQDQRVIFLSDHPPISAHGEVQIALHYQPEVAAQLWIQRTRAQLNQLGVPSEQVERRLHHPLILSLSYLLSLLLDLELLSLEVAAECMSYATLAGGELAHVEEAVELYLHPTLSELTEEESRCVSAYATRDQEVFNESWLALMGGRDQQPELPLADVPL